MAIASACHAADSQNYPDYIVENPSDTGYLMFNKWGTYSNVTLTSNNIVASPEGMTFTTPTEQEHELTVLGKTTIYLNALETDANVVYGIRETTSSSGLIASQINLHDVDIHAESNSTAEQRVMGIWVYGGYTPTPGSHPEQITPSQMTIDGNLNISAKINEGFAMGILVGDEFGGNSEKSGEIYLKGDTNTIYVEQTGTENAGREIRASAGILASNEGKIWIESRQTNITFVTNNDGQGVVQGGIVLSQASYVESDGNLTIDGTATNDGFGYYNLHGISADYVGGYLYGADQASSGVFKGTTDITLRGQDFTSIVGVLSAGASTLRFDGPLSVTLDSTQMMDFEALNAITSLYTGYPGSSESGGTIVANGGLRVMLPEGMAPGTSNAYALRALGSNGLTHKPSIEVNGTETTLVQLNGNLSAKLGSIDLAMKNGASYLTGWANNTGGTINMTLDNGAVWNVVSKVNGTKVVSGDSIVSTVTLGGGILDMTYLTDLGHENWESAGHRQVLEIDGTGNGPLLSGTGGTIRMDVNLANEGNEDDGLNLDQIIVHGDATGSHTLEVNFVGGLDGVDPDKWVSENWLIHQDGGDMTLTGPGGKTSIAGNGMVTLWDVKFVPDGQSNQLADEDFRKSLVNTSNGKGDWYLVRHDELGWTDLEPSTPLPAEPGAVVDVGSTVAQAVSWMSEKNDLRRRLGEVRYGSQAGAWAKAFNRKDRASGFSKGGFEQRSSGVHVGYDTLVSTDESSSWLLGATFRYAQSDQDGLETANGGTGEMDEYSGKVYATWMHESGAYADLIAQVGYYKQDVDGYTNDLKGRWKASYDLWGYGASVEIGHMLTLKNGSDDRRWYNHWFLEPQLELSYFHVDGANFHLSTGMGVH